MQERIRMLRGNLSTALRQWRMYANELRQFDEDRIENASDPEAKMYQQIYEELEASKREEVG